MKLDSFNLIFGRNETGKTLTIDALIKLLFRRGLREFSGIDRVGEKVIGWVVVEESGNYYTITQNTNPIKLIEPNFIHWHKILIIRNSELAIADEQRLYIDVVEHLTGLQMTRIENIKSRLRQLARLTEGGDFLDLKGEKLKSKMFAANQLISQIDEFLADVETQNFDKLQEQVIILKDKTNHTKMELQQLEAARRQEKYQKCLSALNQLRESRQKLEELTVFNDEDNQLWILAEKMLEKIKEEQDTILNKLNDNKKNLASIVKNLQQKQQIFDLLGQKKKVVDGEIKVQIKNYQEKVQKQQSKKIKNKFFSGALVAFLILFSLFSVGIIITGESFFYAASIISLLFSLTLGIFKFQYYCNLKEIKLLLQKLKTTANNIGIEGDTIVQLSLNIERFEKDYDDLHKEIEQLKATEVVLKNKIDELSKQYLNKKEALRDQESKIKNIKDKANTSCVGEYAQKLALKKKLEQTALQQRTILSTQLGEPHKLLQDNLIYWSSQIENLKNYEQKTLELQFDEDRYLKLKDILHADEEKLQNLQEKIYKFQRKLQDIELRVREKVGDVCNGDHISLESLQDLYRIKDRLSLFKREKEITKENALRAIDIFSTIEEKQKKKICDLFGEAGGVSYNFNSISGGLYVSVLFNMEKKMIEVKRKDGVILDAVKLSAGAYDQLYFSIRLCLARSLFADKCGFFIMDDPFIKSDTDRLRKQLLILSEFVRSGWQIIYFCAKDEVKNLLLEDIEKGNVRYIELGGTL